MNNTLLSENGGCDYVVIEILWLSTIGACSVVETHQERRSAFTPVVRTLLAGLQLDGHHKRLPAAGSRSVGIVVHRARVYSWNTTGNE